MTLLVLAAQEKAGRLCAFLGAAPGVGKTYATLRRARAAQDEGITTITIVTMTTPELFPANATGLSKEKQMRAEIEALLKRCENKAGDDIFAEPQPVPSRKQWSQT